MALFNSKLFNPKLFNTDYVEEEEAEGDTWLGPPVPRPTFPIHLLVLIRNYFKSKCEVN